MEKIRRFAQAVILIGVLLGTGSWGLIAGYAQSTSRVAADPPKSESNTWWLMSWGTQEVLCSIPVTHDNVPNLSEVATKCGQDLAYRWLNTPPCEVGKKNIETIDECEGVYLQMIPPEALNALVAPTIGTSDQVGAKSAETKNNLSAANSKVLLELAFTQTFTATLDTCALIWQSYPPDILPTWLQTPESGNLLASEEPFYYLAGRLIANGVVNASQCPSGGLQGDGYANECGLQVAQPQVFLWQNQFDPEIMNVATALGIPAQLMKNLFAQESQFWPGEFRFAYEYGLGQITDQGVDVLFMWNPVFYQAFCPLVLSRETCAPGYMKLSVENRALLRGALASQANADCDSCPTGVDLEKANESISLFANVLIANCTQIGEIVTNLTEFIPGSVASYEDLWRLTIANYHAGPGCITFAMNKTWQEARNLTWADVSERLPGPCSGVRTYVRNITR
jgi:hypothetical protein